MKTVQMYKNIITTQNGGVLLNINLDHFPSNTQKKSV